MSRNTRRPPPVRRATHRAETSTVPPWAIQEMTQALGHLEAGRLAEARDGYVRILERAPTLHQAAHNLALVALEMGDPALARDLAGHAARQAPQIAKYWMTLGVAADKLNDDALAGASLVRAMELDPQDGLAFYNYANLLERLQRKREAVPYQERAAALRPDRIEIWNNLGNLYRATARHQEALACFARALDLQPGYLAAHANLAMVYEALERHEEAIAEARRALDLAPAAAEVRHNLGQWLLNRRRTREALRIFEDGLIYRPDEPLLRVGRAKALASLGRLEETLSEVHWLLARGGMPAIVHSTILFPLHYDDRVSPQQLTAEHRRWAARHADPLTPAPRHWPRRRDPERRLRVGYVSPDLRQHPVAFFLAPVLAAHAASDSIEAICYSCGSGDDGWTAQLRRSAAAWNDARTFSVAELAAQIENDGVDILVDLFGHTSGDHLLAFARKPAPLQLSWLGYVNTTGMKAMDYILLDQVVCPPGEEELYVERPLRLAPCYLSYQGPDYAPEAAPPPALSRGQVTFGSFNTLSKVGFRVLGLWAEVLAAVPRSRLLMRNKEFDEPATREVYFAELERLGIARERVALEGSATHEQLLAYYANLDIALDPFPYNGGTTTCEALWMGVPVVTLAGDRFVGRVSQTILRAAGLEELVAPSPAGYVRRAAGLASSFEQLAALRAGLRRRIQCSALGDTEGFARKLEHAYRTIWRQWCAGNAG